MKPIPNDDTVRRYVKTVYNVSYQDTVIQLNTKRYVIIKCPITDYNNNKTVQLQHWTTHASVLMSTILPLFLCFCCLVILFVYKATTFWCVLCDESLHQQQLWTQYKFRSNYLKSPLFRQTVQRVPSGLLRRTHTLFVQSIVIVKPKELCFFLFHWCIFWFFPWSPMQVSHVVVVVKCCLMSSDVSWHIRDKLWSMPKHGSIILYVHGNQKAR